MIFSEHCSEIIWKGFKQFNVILIIQTMLCVVKLTNWNDFIGDTFPLWKSCLWPVHSFDGHNGSAALTDSAYGVHLVYEHPLVHLQA